MPEAAANQSVLIVDDDPRIREVLVSFLQRMGLQCRTASNGLEALQAVAAAPPDLILLDIMMPELDGIETCRRLKANPAWAEIPVIALTGQDNPSSVAEMQHSGSLMYIAKPFTIENLLTTVRLTLGLL